MIKIYCIEDINDLKYVGSTKSELIDRLYAHRSNKDCSSRKLNLYNCIIYELEECSQEDRNEREQYYMDTIDCVNKNSTVFDKNNYDKYQREYKREYRKKNRDKAREYDRKRYQKNKEYYKEYNKEYQKEYYQKNKDKRKEYMREYREKNKSKNKM